MTTNFWRVIYSAPKYVPGKGIEILSKKKLILVGQIFRENAILPNVGMNLFTYFRNVLLQNVTFPETAKIAKFHPISLTKKK